jgi:hypothetical protein
VPSPHSGGRELTKDREKTRLTARRVEQVLLDSTPALLGTVVLLPDKDLAVERARGEDGSERRVSPSESVHRSFVPASESKLAGVSKLYPELCLYQGLTDPWRVSTSLYESSCSTSNTRMVRSELAVASLRP